MTEAQQRFDFDRAEQLGLLEQAVLPKRPGVSQAACKAVLKAIDNYGRGREAWPSCDTLAVNTGLSVRTVKRALRVLTELSLIVVDRRGVLTLNHYRIVWSELAILAKPKRERSAMVALPGNERSATVALRNPERSAMVAPRSATVSPRSAMVALEPLEETTEETPPPTNHHFGPSSCPSGPLEPSQNQNQEEEALEFLISKADSLGLYSASVVVEAVERTSPEHVAEILQHYDRCGDRYGPGALCTRLRRASLARPPEAGWPPASESSDSGPLWRLASGLSPDAERRRAALIRHGQRSGWSHEQIQRAIIRLESEQLQVV